MVDQRWIDTNNSNASVDRYQYTYDRSSNVLTQTNVNSTGNSETYTYDALNRLTTTDRASGTTDDQSWNLDALGNMSSVTTDSTTEDRTHDSQNELTGMGSLTLSYDHNGSVTTDDLGHHLTFDAWNHLVGVYNDNGSGGVGTLIVAYAYDGAGRRIRESHATGSPTEFYYSSQWQVVEERQGLTVTNQYVWSPVYVDAMIERDRNADGNITNGLEERIYVTQDANFNATTIIAGDGTVLEHFTYNAYGKRTDLHGSWAASGDTEGWLYSFQGLRYDADTGLLHARNRDLSIRMMRWISQDPMGYVDGMNNHAFERDNPADRVDPLGLALKVSTAGGVTSIDGTIPGGGTVRGRLSKTGSSLTYSGPIVTIKLGKWFGTDVSLNGTIHFSGGLVKLAAKACVNSIPRLPAVSTPYVGVGFLPPPLG